MFFRPPNLTKLGATILLDELAPIDSSIPQVFRTEGSLLTATEHRINILRTSQQAPNQVGALRPKKVLSLISKVLKPKPSSPR